MHARTLFNRIVKPPYVLLRSATIGLLERRAGIRTEGYLSPEELGFSPENQQRYQPAHWFALRRILPPREVAPEDVFIDYGSGMGRVVYQAAAGYPFRRVIGLELSERLDAVARENIERTRDRLRCRDVELVVGDALEYELPDDVTVVFFANPFNGPIFESVVLRLLASLERNPRRMRVVYLNPREEATLLRHGFRRTRQLRGLRPGREWSRSNATRLYERVL